MKTSPIVDQMRPDLPALDAECSSCESNSILATPRRPHRRLKRVALGAASLVLATGGAAYATGNIPAFIEQEFDYISTSGVHDMHRIASFTVNSRSAVREFHVCRAINDAGDICSVTHEADGRLGAQLNRGVWH